MLDYDDPRWTQLSGGFRARYDPTSALKKLESGTDVAAAWDELWNELHHQGDIGEASYAAVPHLVRIHKQRRDLDWNFYALISTIEVQRHWTKNPVLPSWLADSYHSAWQDALELAIEDLRGARDERSVRALFGAIALGKGLLTLGAVVSKNSADEIVDVLKESGLWADLDR